ncbi:hypothetical protein PSCICL_07460 [Pseudomonas cichorii]|nr:NADPH-dependent F420 reductase [Pseudomonas cichorii]GFM69754.1 hypothetical protein PSCICL_07460 [Pseudomonas cichorii]
MSKTVGVIGAGMIGSGIARLAVAAGYEVVIANSRGPESLKGLLDELGSKARAGTAEEAAKAAEIIVAALPLGVFKSLPADHLAGKIVVDTMNYYPSARDGRFDDIDQRKLTTSEMIQAHLSSSKVIKALHNLDFHHLVANARPAGDSERTTLPIAGDDAQAKAKVSSLMSDFGYDSVDVGTLADSWRIEPGTPIYVWPYVPEIPERLNEQEAREWYLNHPGKALDAEAALKLVNAADRNAPVGGQPSDLPAIHVALVGEVYKGRG